MAVKQTAGRDALGEFAPKFAELNDDVLFGQVWSREDKLSLRDRSIVTVVALMAQGLTDSSFQYGRIISLLRTRAGIGQRSGMRIFSEPTQGKKSSFWSWALAITPPLSSSTPSGR